MTNFRRTLHFYLFTHGSFIWCSFARRFRLQNDSVQKDNHSTTRKSSPAEYHSNIFHAVFPAVPPWQSTRNGCSEELTPGEKHGPKGGRMGGGGGVGRIIEKRFWFLSSVLVGRKSGCERYTAMLTSRAHKSCTCVPSALQDFYRTVSVVLFYWNVSFSPKSSLYGVCVCFSVQDFIFL